MNAAATPLSDDLRVADANAHVADAHVERAAALLAAGRLQEGWAEYEWRWHSADLQPQARDFSQPLWNGELIGERTILLHAEQGLGDTLQFCRYALLLADARHIVLEVQPPLARLLACLPGIDRVVARGQALPHFDLHCPLMSLPRACGTTLATIPKETPYLSADPAEVAIWHKRLAMRRGLRVGLVWAAESPLRTPGAAAADGRRSLPLEALAPLAEVRGLCFVSLQKGAAAIEAARPPPGMSLLRFDDELHDFAATAALVEALDLVISIDTAVAHLAGALGKPVWLLNRFDADWRWLTERSDSPWYPTLRQFRQPRAGDWHAVIGSVREALQRLDADNGATRELVPAAEGLTTAAETAEEIFHRALAAYRAKHHEEALNLIREALRLRPEFPEAQNGLGNILYAQGLAKEAETALREALRLRPQFPQALTGLGKVLLAQGRPADAEASWREALRLRPEDPATLNNLGNALFALGRPAEAEARYREALLYQPDLAEAHRSRGLALLLLGRFEEGWDECEWRWKTREAAARARHFAQPQWHGEPLDGRVILLHAEQWSDDTLQFCRYAALLPAAGEIILEVQPLWVRLLASLGANVRVVARGEPLPAFDLHCPLASLPRAFGTTLAGIPAVTPYLRTAAHDAAFWRKCLGRLPGLRVGLLWAAEPGLRMPGAGAADTRGSIALKALAPLGAIAGVSWISLQTGRWASQAASPPAGMALCDFTAELHDGAATAALIEALDLVIGVDSAAVHLAGALGKPVWLLNRFDTSWRWLLGRDDSPWYPTLRQFRQSRPGDWSGVIGAVREALAALVAGEAAAATPATPTLRQEVPSSA